MKLKTLINYQAACEAFKAAEAGHLHINGEEYVKHIGAMSVYNYELAMEIKRTEIEVHHDVGSAS